MNHETHEMHIMEQNYWIRRNGNKWQRGIGTMNVEAMVSCEVSTHAEVC
jgi:hypothetical protein